MLIFPLVLRHILVFDVICYFQFIVEKCSIEEDGSLLHRSRSTEFVESEVEAESVVESVVRGEENEIGGEDVDESAELDADRADVSNFPGFGEKDTSDAPVGEDVESCVETGSYHFAAKDERHDLDYLTNKGGKLF